MDEALGTICSLISPDLLFHISSCKNPNEAWKILEGLFGKQDEMRGHMLEVEFLTLDPKASTISNISLQNSRIYCRNSNFAGLINQRRRNKWFSPFSPSLVLNSQYSYLHSILSDSPLYPPGRCLLLRTLSNP